MTDQAAAGQPDAWQISLLGAFRVRCGGALLPAAAWKRRAAKTLFKLLALRPDHSLHAEEAIELLWPEAGADAGRNNLDRTVYYLRQTLSAYLAPGGGQAILLHEGIIRLAPPAPPVVDALLFEEYLRRAAAAAQPIPWLERALALYEGPLLAEDRNEEWVFEPRERLARARALALHRLAAAYQAAGDAQRQ
ncbi:MAG TPA: hypothetical protein VGE07_07315, partial [Herpetosiphonaceae bacterium]